MTIISTVIVPEGIAMAADSRLTRHIEEDGKVYNYPLTDNAQKISLVRNGEVGVSFCGAAIIDEKTIADFIRIFDIQFVTEDATVTKIADDLHFVLRNKYWNYDVGFFVCGYDNDDAYVYSVSKDGAHLVNYDGGIAKYTSSWKGQLEAANYLLSQTPVNYSMMPLKDALDLAEFIVELTIKYERFRDALPTCGGPIDILVITKDYTEFYKQKILKP